MLFRIVTDTENMHASHLANASLDRATNESISKIAYSGYLLKRSNHSYPDLMEEPPFIAPAPAPAAAAAAAHLVDEPDSDTNADESVPYTLPSILHHDTPSSPTNDNERVQHSANLMASFFGMSPAIEQFLIDGETNFTPTTVTPLLQLPTRIQQHSPKSAPISFARNKRQSSASNRNPFTTPILPPENIRHKDGHLWRAKYCVLQDGILYFYRNASDGLSTDANLERLSSCEETPQDLSKSPMPRGWKYSDTGDSSRNQDAKDVIWEKRVALDRVGVVRSAEVEYGACSFELLAIPDEAGGVNNDKLVLRASNSEEMNEWLFQFHMSLGSIMKNIVDAFRPSTAGIDFAYQSPFRTRGRMILPSESSPRLLKQSSSNLSASLSHGHGRSGMHRRRSGRPDSATAVSPASDTAIAVREIILTQSPESNGSPVQFAFETIPFMPRIVPLSRESSTTTVPVIHLHANMDTSPEISGVINPETERPPAVTPIRSGVYVPPHLRSRTLERPTPKRYVPPSMRNRFDNEQRTSLSLEELAIRAQVVSPIPAHVEIALVIDEPAILCTMDIPACVLGGCADPSVAIGSIMDPMYTNRKASKVEKVSTKAFGCFGGGHSVDTNAVQWEIGALSECGIRESQEDSFLICNDLIKTFEDLPESVGKEIPSWSQSGHKPGVFAIFDGHCGNQAARFAAEKFPYYLCEKSKSNCGSYPSNPQDVAGVLERAIRKLDDDFCRICIDDGRDWDCGTTALVVAIANGHVVIANLGDCRAVMCRSVEMCLLDNTIEAQLETDGWTQDEYDVSSKWEFAVGNESSKSKASSRWCYWKEVSDVHDPSREDERKRIEDANGWVTIEKEIPIGQLQRMDLYDEDVKEILIRCFTDRFQEPQSTSTSKKACNAAPQRILQISRVCGELGVSRAIGDRDFKAAFNQTDTSNVESIWWKCPLPLPYDDEHSRQFKGDLVISMPDIQMVQLSQKVVIDEFLLLACDGLWDVMDADDAIRIIRGLLFEKKWPAKKAAARLAEVAIHLGSSDNITVIVIRFFTSVDDH